MFFNKNLPHTSNCLYLILVLTISCTQRDKNASSEPSIPKPQNEVIGARENDLVPEPIETEPERKPMTPIYPTFGGGGGGAQRQKACGNGKLESAEQCDDGNEKSNDGCSKTCEIEANFPLCTWQCDDPQCEAICDPVCEPPQCAIQCGPLGPTPNCECEVKCEKPLCEIRCPDDGCEVDSCPQCETVCEPAHCLATCQKIDMNGVDCSLPTPSCSPLCEETQCSWKCHKPECQTPQCELQCEQVTQGC